MPFNELLTGEDIDKETYEITNHTKDILLKNKVFIILDGISDKTHS